MSRRRRGRKNKNATQDTATTDFVHGAWYILVCIGWIVIMYAGRAAFTSLPIFNLLITFGGISTYDQTVVTGVVAIIIIMVLDLITG